MSEEMKNSKESVKYPERAHQTDAAFGWFKDFFGQFQLAWRLLLDGRVSILTKFVPLLTALYVISPFDIISDFALGFGQLDDLAIFLIGLRLFIDLCPPELVKEHKGDYKVEAVWMPPDGEVIDVEARMPSEDSGTADTEDEF